MKKQIPWTREMIAPTNESDADSKEVDNLITEVRISPLKMILKKENTMMVISPNRM